MKLQKKSTGFAVLCFSCLITTTDYSRAQTTREEREAEQAAKYAEEATQRMASATAYLKEALKKVSAATGSLASPDAKRDARQSTEDLMRKAHDELVFVRPRDRAAEAEVTYQIAKIEIRNPKTWDARKVKDLIEKMIKQLNQPQPLPNPKPVIQPARPPLPVAQPLPKQNPQPGTQKTDFFNLKQPLPAGQK